MPSTKHLEILEKGVEFWNEWRKNNPREIPNLKQAVLIDKEWDEINFSDAKLQGADLALSDLSNSNLRNAKTWKTIFRNVIFQDADLRGIEVDKSFRDDIVGKPKYWPEEEGD